MRVRERLEKQCGFCGKPIPNRNKYCDNLCQSRAQRKKKVEEGKAGPKALKSFLVETKGRKCWSCNTEEWMGQPIPLELEHIDGNSENNSLDNLEILCCNCHALTSTYKNKNKGNGRHYRRERYREGKSYCCLVPKHCR